LPEAFRAVVLPFPGTFTDTGCNYLPGTLIYFYYLKIAPVPFFLLV